MRRLLYNFPGSLLIVWSIIILMLCATPGQYIPSTSWLNLLSFDKWVHASIFFILSTLVLAYSFKRRFKGIVIIILVLFCIIYGGALEIMQAKIFSNRSADWLDFIANTFGCLAALAFYKKLRQLFVSGS